MATTAGEAAAQAARRAEALRVHETSAMLLSFFNLSFPSALASSHHPPRRSDTPVNRLLPLLSDGILLADIVALLCPTRLPPSSILRSIPRNALSLPSSNARPVDARQKDVLYNTNTRKVVTAVRKLLDDVRASAVPTLLAPPNAADAYLGDVTGTSPERDIRPALRLAELVVAAAVYGPDGRKYAASFWQLPSDAARVSFHKSMTAVAHAMYLPMPDGLYADREGEGAQPQVERSASAGLVGLERRHDDEVGVAPIAAEGIVVGADEGMGGRKISMVTEDEAGSGGGSPPRPVEDADVLGSGGGESVSEEFYTPREVSLSPRRDAEKDLASGGEVFSPMAMGGAAVRSEYVAETVRQSVTTSITKNMSNVQVFEEDDGMGTINTDISSLNLGESGRHNEDIEEPGSVGYERDSAKPVDFCDPSFMMSPSGSDVPAPSNQWQIERQRAAAASVMSPQQLFSPPRMPRRLSRTAAAAQITPPPGPPLFRADSPHWSVSSAGARSSQEVDNQYLGKAPRVSFAPNIISPGGHQRPLGRSLRTASPEVRQAQLEGSASKGAGFSVLPPSAAGGAGPSQVVGHPEQTAHESRDSQTSEQAVPAYVEPRDPGDELWEDSGAVVADEQEYTDEDEGDVATNESVSSEKPSFQEVDEFVVKSPEQDSSGQRQETEYTSRVSTEHPLGVDKKRSDVKDGSSTGDAFETGSVGDVGSEGVLAGKGSIDGFQLDALYDEKAAMEALNYTPGMSPMRTPVPASPAQYSRAYPREVPPTPPSPPTVAALVESITPRRQTSDAIDTRPVSTMEPSAGLFQKLISVWQNSEEEGAGSGQPARVRKEISLPLFAPEATTSYSTQESTLPSGDTDMEFGRPQGQMESPRSRRRRGIRMDSGSPAARDLRRSQAMSDDSGHQDEKGSVASFSDAFSSDKERNWLYGGRTAADGYDWEEAMRGDNNAGIPVSTTQGSQGMQRQADSRKDGGRPVATSKTRPPLPPSPRTSGRKSKSSTGASKGVVQEGQFLKVDRRRLDWLTRELLSARDAISRQELQMTFAETQRLEQEEVLLLDKQNAESVVDAMKKILGAREAELKDARSRLSVAIEGVGSEQRASRSSETSIGGDNINLKEFISDRHTKLHSRMDETDRKRREADEVMAEETRALWVEVQRALIEKMTEMTEKRDAELELLRAELVRRQKIADDLQKSRADLQTKNDGMQSDMQALRLEKERAAHRYQMEMAHVGAQVELVNEFSKKLHDNFRETENLRQQVLQYQDKLAHITSTSGVSQRQIKELREAVTRANDECARLRREAEMAKRAGMEAVRRAEELEELRRDSGGSRNRLPDRQDRSLSGSFHSHEPVRPAGQNRPGGTGAGARYHNATRGRGVMTGPTPAQKAWLVIKDKIGGIVTGKEGTSSRRRPTGHSGRREYGRSPSAHSGSRSSSHSRSRRSPREEEIARGMRSPSVKSRSSHASGSTVRSGPPRSTGSSRRASPAMEREYMHDSPKSRGEMRIRAVDF